MIGIIIAQVKRLVNGLHTFEIKLKYFREDPKTHGNKTNLYIVGLIVMHHSRNNQSLRYKKGTVCA